MNAVQDGARAHQEIDLQPTSEFIIRPATTADVEPAVELIYLPMGALADYLFGQDDAERARDVLRRLFLQTSNRFSHEFCEVLETGGRVAGLLLAYPSEQLKSLAVPMGSQLREIVGMSGMLRLLRRSLPFMRARETEPDEFYVYTLAVGPDFQSRGLGAQLLAHAETKGRALNLPKCSLGVTLDNDAAMRFYERHGYEGVETIATPSLEKAIGYPGYRRMVKILRARNGERGAALR